MGKAKSDKSCGLNVQCHIDKAKDKVREIAKPDKGTLLDKLTNRNEYVDQAVDAANPPKPKPKPPPKTSGGDQDSASKKYLEDKKKLDEMLYKQRAEAQDS